MSFQYAGNGTTVGVSPYSYNSITLSANINLSWPTQYQDVNQNVAQIIDVNPTGGGFSITLPDARDVSVGQAFIINNVGANTFRLNKNDGTALINTVATGTSTFAFIYDNTTAAGLWRITPYGQGITAVTSVAAVSGTTGIVITGSPITAAGTFTFNLGADLLALNGLGAATGFAVRTAANTWTTRSIVGSANIQVTNGTGVGGNVGLALSNNVTGLTQLQVGNIQLNTNTISTLNMNGNLVLAPNGTGEVQSNNNINIQSDNLLKFYNTANTFYTSFKSAPLSTVTTNYIWPAAYPATDEQAIVSDMAGNLSFIAIPVGTIPGINRVVNGDFQIWQRGAGGTATFTLTNTTIYGPDRWQVQSGGAGTTVIATQIATASGSPFAARIQRQSGNNGTDPITLSTSLPISRCIGMSGEKLTISFMLNVGSNISSNLITVDIITGTGTNDVSNLTTGFINAATLFTTNIVANLGQTYYEYTTNVVPNNVTQVAIDFYYTPVGVAGANDFFMVTDVQLEVSDRATPFQRLAFDQELSLCQFYYRKSFNYNLAPATNLGDTTGESQFNLAVTGAVESNAVQIYFGTPMRTATGTLVTYNITGNNSNVRDKTANVDQMVTATKLSDRGFTISVGGNAGSTVADSMAYHWTYDCELV